MKVSFSCLLLSALFIHSDAAANETGIPSFLAIQGSGSSTQGKAHWKLMQSFRQMLAIPALMTYRSINSPIGGVEFLNGQTDFAASELAIPANSIPTNRTILQLPLGLSMYVVIANFPGGSLQLSPSTLCKIFKNDIKHWDDPAILTDNPKLKVPKNQRISIVRVVNTTGLRILDTYFAKQADPQCRLDTSKINATTVPSPVSDYVSDNQWTIAVSDTNGKGAMKLEVAIANKDGVYMTSASSDETSLGNLTWPAADGDWTAANAVNMPGHSTWPLLAVSFIQVWQDQSQSGLKGQLLRSYLEYATNKAAQKVWASFGQVDFIPPSFLNISQAGLALLAASMTTPPFRWERNTPIALGADLMTISDNRQEFYDVSLQMKDTRDNAIDAKLAALRADVKNLQRISPVSGPTPADSGDGSSDQGPGDAPRNSPGSAAPVFVYPPQSNGVALAALLVALAALMLCLYLFLRLYAMSRSLEKALAGGGRAQGRYAEDSAELDDMAPMTHV